MLRNVKWINQVRDSVNTTSLIRMLRSQPVNVLMVINMVFMVFVFLTVSSKDVDFVNLDKKINVIFVNQDGLMLLMDYVSNVKKELLHVHTIPKKSVLRQSLCLNLIDVNMVTS